ncbi:MAG TPA: EAL domain-containing protein, partial [Thermoanaerobaculia bacterium]|nr:EAL domain-containing protein [Thermoanaerobaculia bacterium]
AQKKPAAASPRTDLARIAIENAPDAIVILTPPGDGTLPRILFVNQAFCRMSGTSAEEVIGQPFEIFRAGENERPVHDILLHPLSQHSPFEGEATAYRRDGTEYFIEVLLVPIHGAASQVTHWVAYMKDVSERKAQVAILEQQALHDMLTRLPNRTLLLDRVDQAVRLARRSGAPVGLMLLDLNGFKEVNDTLGHHTGDIVLQQVAARLRELMRESDTVARLGGDEFAFVLPTARDAASAYRVGQKVLRALESPFVVEGARCEIGASIGIAMFPEHGSDAETLMKRADTAMYDAKRRGAHCTVYTPQLEAHGGHGISIGAELRQALENGELELYYQPKIHLRTGLMTRVEALVRWNHPERGLVQPDAFIPAAEKSGLIRNLTEWVIHAALEQSQKWQDQMLPIHVAVNLSAKVLQEHLLPQIIANALEKWRVPPQSLKIEITESSIMADPQHAFAILSLLQSLGVRLSLDDFGTGYSSLMHLRQLPVDEIKIDKSFVMGMATSAGDAAIVRATIDLGHNLGMQVVAEGVDNEWTCKILTELGCDLAQGYYLSPPLPAPQLVDWLSETGWGLSRWQKMIATKVERA